MPALASWQKGKKSYIQAMTDRFDPRHNEYGFNIVKGIYAAAFRLESALNDVNGIDPQEADYCIKAMAKAVEELQEWQGMKERQEREGYAAYANRA